MINYTPITADILLALPEIWLALAAMGLLMFGVFRREESVDLVNSMSVLVLAITAGFIVLGSDVLLRWGLIILWIARKLLVSQNGDCWWIGLKDYLLLWLTGKLVTELSSASGTGLLDLASRTWSEDALALTGVSRDQLPEILPTTAVLELAEAPARRAGLPAGTPVITGAADGPLGNLGTGAVTPGVAGLSLGTSGAIRMAVDQPSVDDLKNSVDNGRSTTSPSRVIVIPIERPKPGRMCLRLCAIEVPDYSRRPCGAGDGPNNGQRPGW